MQLKLQKDYVLICLKFQLSPTELINLSLKSALDDYELVQMNEKASIRDCILDGHLSLDMAISKKTCEKTYAGEEEN